MRKHCCLSIFFLLFFILSFYDAAGQFSGVKTVYKLFDTIMGRGDHPPVEAIRKVITNKKGDVFLLGRHGWPNRHAFNIGQITIRKVDRSGNDIWKKVSGTIWYSADNLRSDVVEAVATSDGGIVVLTVNETIAFGNDFSNNEPGWTAGDIYLCKFSASGQLEWEKNVGGTRWDEALSLSIDRYENILIAGRTWSVGNDFAGKRRSIDTSSLAYKSNGGMYDTSVVGIGYDTLITQYRTMNDAFVAKLSPAGQLMNLKCYGGTLSEKLIHVHDHPVYGYVAIGYSDSKNMDLPAEGTKGGIWMLHLDTALNIIQNKVIDPLLMDGSLFFIKDKRMYLSNSSRFREIGYDGTIVRDHAVNDVTFNEYSYFDSSGYIYKPAGNRRLDIYDSLLQFRDSVTFPGWQHRYFSIDGVNRNNLHLISYTFYEHEIWLQGDVKYYVHSNLVINFADQFNFLKGKVFVDANKNNLFDTLEFLQGGIKVEAEKHNSIFTVTTNNTGSFSVPLDTGSYRIKITSALPYYNAVPSEATIQFTSFGLSDSINFALQPIPNKKDLQVNLLPLNIARPGFEVNYKIVGYNKGTVAIPNVQVKMRKDSRVNYTSAVPVVSSTNADTLIWNIGTVEPLDSFFIDVKGRLQAPPAVNNSDTLIHKAFVLPVIGDEVVTDNETKLVERVQGSYDPNDKTETHGGIITPEQLAGNDHLTYLIRFQNTGTDTAFNVIIRDTLTNKLHWSSFEMISTSHPYQLYMIKPHILEFSFPNILLVDSNRNEPASHGFIAYRIKPKSNLSIGDTVLNRAHIYFDYNLPVITNDELTILRNNVVTSVIDLNREAHQLLLYPNPSNGLVTVSKKERMAGNAVLQITDINGMLLQQIQLGKISTDNFNQTIDISGLPSGIYVVKLQVGNTSYLTKFVLQ